LDNPQGVFPTSTWGGTGPDYNSYIWGSASKSLPKTFRDGTSNTIVFGERYSICVGPAGNPQPSIQSMWSYDYYNAAGYSLRGPAFAPIGRWNAQTIRDTPQFLPTDAQCDYGTVQAFSSGILLVGLGDGSVRGVSPGITLTTWYFALDPADGHTLGADW